MDSKECSCGRNATAASESYLSSSGLVIAPPGFFVSLRRGCRPDDTRECRRIEPRGRKLGDLKVADAVKREGGGAQVAERRDLFSCKYNYH
ncbi:hypothetical protein GCM10027267_28930 [Paramicrobacterium agarici]